jgi:hypothetical protein
MHAKSVPTLHLTTSIGSAVAFLRAAAKLSSNGDYSVAIQAIAAHAEELTVVSIANGATYFTIGGWNEIQRAVLKHCITAPGPSASAENDLRECPGRLQNESFDVYYSRFQSKYETCTYVRTLFNEVTSSDWSNTYHRQWVLNLNIPEAYMLTMSVTHMSTFASVFAAVCRSVSPAVRAGTLGTFNASKHQERLTHINTVPLTPAPDLKDDFSQLKATFEDRFDNQDKAFESRFDNLQRGLHTKLNAMSVANNESNPSKPFTPSSPRNERRGNARSRSPPPTRKGRARSRSPQPIRKGRAPPSGDNQCYNCGKSGHFSSNCTAKCGECGSSRHTSHACPTRIPKGGSRHASSTIRARLSSKK